MKSMKTHLTILLGLTIATSAPAEVAKEWAAGAYRRAFHNLSEYLAVGDQKIPGGLGTNALGVAQTRAAAKEKARRFIFQDEIKDTGVRTYLHIENQFATRELGYIVMIGARRNTTSGYNTGGSFYAYGRTKLATAKSAVMAKVKQWTINGGVERRVLEVCRNEYELVRAGEKPRVDYRPFK